MSQTSNYPRIRVAGTARERGQQYGEQASERIAVNIAAYKRVFAHYARWDWPEVLAQANLYRAAITAFDHAIMAEIEGIAEGAGVGPDEILALNVRTEVMFAAKARDASATLPRVAECTSMALLPERTGSTTLLSQNWDWLVHSFDTVVIVECEREDAPNYVTVVEAGLLAKFGMNSAGIAIGVNAMVSTGDQGAADVPFHVLLRALLDAQTPTAALETLQRAQRASSGNFLIVSGDDLAVDIEAEPGDYSRLYPLIPEAGLLLHANHFLSPRFPGPDVGLLVMPDSIFRQQRAASLLAGLMAPIAPGDLMGILSDHAGHPLGLCCHPTAQEHEMERGATIASVVMEPVTRRIWLAQGQPCAVGYQEIESTSLREHR